MSDRVTQKYLKEKGLMAMIGFLSAFIPLSIDLYIPALPTMAEKLNTSPYFVNMTLTMFLMFYGISTLVWGPLSDKYGRKPILLIGTSIYTVASLLCFTSTSVYFLIGYRVLQAIGGGAVVAVANAIAKDSFEGEKREKMFALSQSMAMISPIVAPILGAFILTFTSWRGLFLALGGVGVIALTFTILFKESIEQKSDNSIVKSIGSLFVVLKNRKFAKYLLLFSLMAVPILGFVAASSYIYINEFHLEEKVFSMFFAFNSVFLVIGPLVYLKVAKKIKKEIIAPISFFIIFISGLLLYNFGLTNPIMFALLLFPATFFNGLIRPLGVSLIFRQHTNNAGAVSSMIGFTYTLFGFIGMTLTSLNLFKTNITLIACMNIGIGLFNFIVWKIMHRS